jgi:hypothetical protein
LFVMLAACGRLEFTASPDARPDGQSDAPLLDLGPGATYSDVIRASAPRVWFRMDDPDSTVCADSSGNGFNGDYGTFAGGTLQFARTGALLSETSMAVRMDADGNVGPTDSAGVQYPATSMSWAGDFTVEMFWLSHQDAPAGWSNAVFVCEDYNTNGFRLGWNQTRQLHAWTMEAGSTGHLYSDMTPISMTEFNHVALVHEGSLFTLYLNAVPVGSDAMPYIPVGPLAECGFGSIHGMPSYSTYDEVAIYPRALGAAELAAHLAAR